MCHETQEAYSESILKCRLKDNWRMFSTEGCNFNSHNISTGAWCRIHAAGFRDHRVPKETQQEK